MNVSSKKAGNSQQDESKKLIEDRKSDATSKETLNDVKQNEKAPETKGSGEGTSVPAPDGTPDPDQGGGRADGSDTGGPM